jgi:hypothetical protein
VQQNPILGESQSRPESSEAEEQGPGPAAPATAIDRGGRDESGVDGPGMSRLDPTRYGDWEKDGRCIDF